MWESDGVEFSGGASFCVGVLLCADIAGVLGVALCRGIYWVLRLCPSCRACWFTPC